MAGRRVSVSCMFTAMKILDNMENCYGCGACYSICPTGAIEMKENAEGFLEPVIDMERCISCEKCKRVCPTINPQYPNNLQPDIYAFSAEEKVLYDSSSGGVFTFLAEHILHNGGYVAGAAYDQKFMVSHTIIRNIEDLDKIRRSKYLQSSTNKTFQKTKELLDKGECVLYSGCPCQIAGLLRFLGKDYDNLYTVDVLCHGVPSPKLFREHLRNFFGGSEDISKVEFRSREGWDVLWRVTSKDGEDITIGKERSIYLQSFLQDINLRSSCFQCQYSRLPRQGDITMGDLWAARNLNLSYEFSKGVSVVLVNSNKGEALFQKSLGGAKYKFNLQKLWGNGVEKPCNRDLLNSNIFCPTTSNGNPDKRQKFFQYCSNMSFESAVYASLHPFDIGLMLNMSDNYGSIATNYALYKKITDEGKRAAVIDNLVYEGELALRFARKYMKLCSDFMERGDTKAVNQCFGTYIVGSDISWDWNLNRWSRPPQYMMLGFADAGKRLISYAPSFGSLKGKNDIGKYEMALYAHYLKRFEAISVREDYGVVMCKELFGVEAIQVVDPVFLCDKQVWYELSAVSQIKFDEEYLLAYILDPTPVKRQVILDIAKNLKKRFVVILDQELNYENNRKQMNLDENLVRPEFTDWLAYFHHASYIITDSMHGVCFSILFGKRFVAIKNRSKGRFESLANLIGYPQLFYDDCSLLLGKDNIFKEIDYDNIYKRIDLKQKESEAWLHAALRIKIKQKSDIESLELMQKLFQALREKTDLVNQLNRKYAYDEERKERIYKQIEEGKTWLNIVLAENNMMASDSKLQSIGNLKEYFSALREYPDHIIVLSGADECSQQWRKFVEVSGLQLRTDIGWRDSYAAIVDGGDVKVEHKQQGEISLGYEFIIGHPKYDVEYVNGQLKVGCMPLKRSGIRIKSKGYAEPSGAWRSEILVDNINYSMNKTGINIVVIDKESGIVLDTVNVNTYSDPGLRINRV